LRFSSAPNTSPAANLETASTGLMRGLRLHDFFDYWVKRQPDVEFATERDRSINYGEAGEAIDRLANALRHADLHSGDRIAILARNCIEYALIYFACSKAGVVPVPLNYRSAPVEWAYVITDAGAKLVIAQPQYMAVIDRIRGDIETVSRWIVLGSDAQASGWTTWTEWLADEPSVARDNTAGADDDLYQLYTSGTTGKPKGAVLSQAAVVSNLIQIALSSHRGAPGERALVVGPMLHAGVVWTTLAPLAWGAALYIMEDFVAADVVRSLDEERIGYAVLVPTMLHTLVQVVGASERAYASMRLIHTGSAPISDVTLRRASETFRCDVVHAYGLTEATAAVTSMTAADIHEHRTVDPSCCAQSGDPSWEPKYASWTLTTARWAPARWAKSSSEVRS
jgi:acyl-CoA synthetase (AMP-forming)/AMP-acid ligase II